MAQVTMLSEIHPAAVQMFNPLEQAADWYGLVSEADQARFANPANGLGFVDAIALIEERCREKGQHLLIRDWAHLDFTGVPFVSKASYRFGLAEALQRRFVLKRVAVVRHPVDQWLSLRRLDIIKGPLAAGSFSLKLFLKGYAQYAEQSVSIGFFRYEDFTRNPEKIMKAMCEALELPFDADFIDHWYRYETITGSKNNNREKQVIKPLPRQECAPELLRQFRANKDYKRAVRLLGYEP
jgi:hypothetical protein